MRVARRVTAVLFVTGAVLAAFLWATGFFERQIYRIDYESYVETYSEENGLPQSLVYAVIFTESRFKKDAVSSVGASGLMQIMPDTFDWIKYRMGDKSDITYESMFDPEQNIKYGTFLLNILITDFGNYESALAAYHAGYSRVEGWLKNEAYSHDGESLHTIPYTTTNLYVRRVMEAAGRYQSLYNLD